MMSMPGVASTSDQINELVVRSGKPTKNLTVFDGIETHSSHFGVKTVQAMLEAKKQFGM